MIRRAVLGMVVALAVLAQLAAVVRPTPRPLPDDALLELRALLERRRQLVEMLTACIRRLLTILNAMLKTQQRWQPALATTA